MPKIAEASVAGDQVRAGWDAIAAGYDQFVTDTEVWLANEALTRAGVQHGQRFLDVACGCGGLSLPAARLGAAVTATDWSPAMIERLTARAASERLTNIEARVMDCHALNFEDDAFDVTGSQFGVMLVPDQPAAIREMARVTRPGGRVLLIAYGPPADIEFLHLFVAAIQEVDPAFVPPLDPPPLEFQASDAAVLRERLLDAGLKGVVVETVTEKLAFASGQHLWDWVLNGNPLPGLLIGHLSASQKLAVRDALDRLLHNRADASGVAILTDSVHIAVATK